MNSPVTVKKHHDLQRFSERELHERGADVFRCADQGVQTAMIGANGQIRSVVGLNGIRYLPDPDPDPMDEVMLLALDAAFARKRV